MNPPKADIEVDSTTAKGAAVSRDASLETPGRSATVSGKVIIEVDSVDFHYGASKALHGLSLKVPEKQVTAFIGPSGCGKSTLLRSFTRMTALVDPASVTAGAIKFQRATITAPTVDGLDLRTRAGIACHTSKPFP